MTEKILDIRDPLERLMDGNKRFVEGGPLGDMSEERRIHTEKNQHPYAVIVTCSDSRVIPEAIFSAGIGDLFVIRTAGNTVDDTTLGCIEYAIEHLGCHFVMVLGHTHCGAIAATLENEHGRYSGTFTRKIESVIGTETDPMIACRMNILNSVSELNQCFSDVSDLVCVGALYNIHSGTVQLVERALFKQA